MSTEVTTPVAESAEVKNKPGRPVMEGSKRQQKLAERAAKEAAGETVKRGRPAVEGSKRQERLAKQAERKASGAEIKPGRPKGSGTKVEVPTTAATADAAAGVAV